MVRFSQFCIFWFGILLVPAVGFLMLTAGVPDFVMVTYLGVAVIVAYFTIKAVLSWQRKRHVGSLDDYFETVLHSTSHETLRDNLETLLRKIEEVGWNAKERVVSERHHNLRKCLELTVTAINYKESRRADPETLKRLKLDLPNLEIQLRSISWGERDASVAQRFYEVRYQYWYSFAAALRIWSAIAVPMMVITVIMEATAVLDAGRNPADVYTLGYYAVGCLVSFVIAKVLGLC